MKIAKAHENYISMSFTEFNQNLKVIMKVKIEIIFVLFRAGCLILQKSQTRNLHFMKISYIEYYENLSREVEI
jgi:hypothetical protein